MLINNERLCSECGEIITGRSDKKFCSNYCRSSYHYKKNLNNNNNLFVKIDKTLKQNRLILKKFNKSGKSTVRKETLLNEGFNPKYFTHYWKAKNNNLYLFCYEFGFMEKTDNGKSKYILITWQDYMK